MQDAFLGPRRESCDEASRRRFRVFWARRRIARRYDTRTGREEPILRRSLSGRSASWCLPVVGVDFGSSRSPSSGIRSDSRRSLRKKMATTRNDRSSTTTWPTNNKVTSEHIVALKTNDQGKMVSALSASSRRETERHNRGMDRSHPSNLSLFLQEATHELLNPRS